MEAETPSAWRVKRQFIYFGIVILAVLIPLATILYLIAPRATCFDGRQNQNELGIDCGGGCAKVCKEEVKDLIVGWQRAFLVRTGEYDLGALLTNTNKGFTATHISYTFSVRDEQNKVLATREGKTFMNPESEFIIFEPRIHVVSGGIPTKVFFEIKDVEWKRTPGYEKPQLKIDNEVFTEKPLPRLSAQIRNPLPQDFKNVEAIAEVRSDEDTIVALSKSTTQFVARESATPIFFEWPQALPAAAAVCARPVEAVLLFDLSGSMDDDNANPPQPLTDAKGAAATFVDALGKKDKIGLVSFATEAKSEGTLSTPQKEIKNILSALSITPEEQHGRTNIGDAIIEGTKLFEVEKSAPESTARRVMILLTDGLTNAPVGLNAAAYARDSALSAKGQGIDMYAIGLGKNVNQSFLRDTIAGSPDNYYFSATSKELAGIYQKIAADVCPEKVYITRILERTNNELESSD